MSGGGLRESLGDHSGHQVTRGASTPTKQLLGQQSPNFQPYQGKIQHRGTVTLPPAITTGSNLSPSPARFAVFPNVSFCS